MSFQTYDAMTAGRRADQPVDVLAALAGLVQFASRLRTCPPAALAFLRHADGLLRGTEAAPGVARTWAETVLFAEVSVREAQKELARVEDEAAAPAPAAAASSFSGFGDRLRSVFGPGDEARQRERPRPRRPSLLEHWPRAAPPQPPPFARRASSIEADACGAISGCGVQDTSAAYRAEPHKVETPPGAEKKRKRRLEEVTTDVQRLDLAEQSTDMDAAAAARLVATAEAEITEGDDLLEGGAMVENAPCGEAAALKFHAACVRLEGVRCAAQHLPAPLKRTAASELAYARRAAKTHAPLLENCVVERALYDARDADLRTISRQASAASDRRRRRCSGASTPWPSSTRAAGTAPRAASTCCARSTSAWNCRSRPSTRRTSACGTGPRRRRARRAPWATSTSWTTSYWGGARTASSGAARGRATAASSRARPSGCGAARAGTGCTPRSRRRASWTTRTSAGCTRSSTRSSGST